MTKLSTITNGKQQGSYLIWFLIIWHPYFSQSWRWLRSLQITKFYTFLKRLYVSTLKTCFLRHDMKVGTRRERAKNSGGLVKIKKITKAYQTPEWKLPVIISSISWYCLTLTGEKQAKNKTKICSQKKTQALNTPIWDGFGSEASAIFSWPSPPPVCSNIISLRTKMCHTIRKWQDIFFWKRKMQNE